MSPLDALRALALPHASAHARDVMARACADALDADGAAALACALAAWLGLPAPERAETLPLLRGVA